MKILALISSSRIGSNTDILFDRVLQDAQICGHAAGKIYLYDYQIMPCIDCRRCKKEDFICHLLDWMSEIYPSLHLIIYLKYDCRPGCPEPVFLGRLGWLRTSIVELWPPWTSGKATSKPSRYD